MSEKIINYCPCCGHKVVEYKHLMNYVLVNGLLALYEAGGTAPISVLKLAYSEKANFQKLKYFKLVEKCTEQGRKREYKLTESGLKFINGVGTTPSFVKTVNGNVVGVGDPIYRHDVKIPVQVKEEWEEQASNKL